MLVIQPTGHLSIIPNASFEACQNLVNGMVEVMPSNDNALVGGQRISVLVNEEGLLHGMQWNPYATALTGVATGWMQDVVGPVVFVGNHGSSFESLEPAAIIELVTKVVPVLADHQ